MIFKPKATPFSLAILHKVSGQYASKVSKFIILITICLLGFLPYIQIDTDPENMLAHDDPSRVSHRTMKEKYNIYDMLVIGVSNPSHPKGVFNVDSLNVIHDLNQYILALSFDAPLSNTSRNESLTPNNTQNKTQPYGVVKRSIIAPSNLDNIAPGENNQIQFEWVMPTKINTEQQALVIKKRLQNNDLFKGTVVSDDGKSISLYIPITDKTLSHPLYNQINNKISTLSGAEQFHITGLPVAEDVFGVEMFIQMAIVAPAAMALIGLLIYLVFSSWKFTAATMAVAMVSVLFSMGGLIATGNTVHIMSSMIPIFIMPIAILDSIHILSHFRCQLAKQGNKEQALTQTMATLHKPMLFTSLTTAAGFASLALTPIPPVQIFGCFVALGIIIAWLFSISFIPWFVRRLDSEQLMHSIKPDTFSSSFATGVSGILKKFNQTAQYYPKLIIGTSFVLCAIALVYIPKIVVNDNPMRWFEDSHPIRQADHVLNESFSGTYMTFLELAATEISSDKQILTHIIEALPLLKHQVDNSILSQATAEVNQYLSNKVNHQSAVEELSSTFWNRSYTSDNEHIAMSWEQVANQVDVSELYAAEVFKQPKMLRYLDQLEEYVSQNNIVGKYNGINILIKKVNKELQGGADEHYKIPDTFSGVGQSIISYQNSHRPERLWHCVSPNYRAVNLWFQLKSGDNIDVEKAVNAINDYITTNPPPVKLKATWYGLPYLNIIWQEKMVTGMGNAILAGCAVVLMMLVLLTRSISWGIIAMLPPVITIAFIYGVIGLFGKDYDMPVAVLSSLTLGLAVDFSIHFIMVTKQQFKHSSSWRTALNDTFGDTSHAILLNMLVLAIGFLPLLLSTLTPYKTVGVLLASILVISAILTLLLLPAIIMLLDKKPQKGH